VKSGGRIVAYLREANDRIELIGLGGKLLGTFLKHQNVTLHPGGRLVGYGNLLLTLVED
jgi:hypothetical protein